MNTRLIRNTTNESHLHEISKLLKRADEINIAVAFVKSSGISELIHLLRNAVKRKAVVKIIAGRHFALTEPEALKRIQKLFKGTKSKLYLANLNNDEVFHPKLYLFKNKQTATIISGSANITYGGLEYNYEVSLMHNLSVKAELWEDALNYFNELVEYHSILCDDDEIEKYEAFYEEQRKARKGTKAAPEFKKTKTDYNYEKLHNLLQKYDVASRNKDYADRKRGYSLAIGVLDEIATSDKLNRATFSDLLDELVGGSDEHFRYWMSNGLFRGKYGKNGKSGVYDHWREFRDLVRLVRGNKSKSPRYVFENGKKMIDKIPQAGVNYLTEIMMTYNPEDFANINKKPISVLTTQTDVLIKKTTSAYTGEDYQNYCAIVKDIRKYLGLRDMIEADAVFNQNFNYLKKKGAVK